MTDGAGIEARHDLTPDEIGWLEDRLYDFNMQATGHRDGQGLAFVITDAAGERIGAAAGYSWGGFCEVRQVWVAEAHRGQGHARTLMAAVEAEARRRGCRQILLMTYDFQAPGLYEKLGFERLHETPDQPSGHVSLLMRKRLQPTAPAEPGSGTAGDQGRAD